MTTASRIEWTDHTFNPWWGCSRVSPACRFCYAERDARRYGHQVWRRHGPRRLLSEANWRTPLKWNRDAERAGVPAKVFCASMADVFEDHPAVAEPRQRLWRLIEDTPWLRWQLLTKRPENVAGMVPWSGGSWPEHVWLGTSVENQRYALERIPVLLEVPGVHVRFLSCEPLLGPLDLTAWLPPLRPVCVLGGPLSDRDRLTVGEFDRYLRRVGGQPTVDWVITGGESGGPRTRPMHPDWVRALRDQATAAGVPFLFKQWGNWVPESQNPAVLTPSTADRALYVELDGSTRPAARGARGDAVTVQPVGKHRAGRLLDGRTWDEYPSLTAAGGGADG